MAAYDANYSPWRIGDTTPYWNIPLNTDSGPDDITGILLSSFVMSFNQGGQDRIGTGTFTLNTINPASVIYAPSPADVAQPFNGNLIPSMVVGGSVTSYYKGIPFVISD